jgi:23S rRNA pseudouridine2605 synthase
VAGDPPQDVLDKLTEGIWLAEGKVRAKHVRKAGSKGEATVLEMVLAEGKNREVRRMLAKLGHKVMSLTRVAVGPITLKGMKPGHFRFLSPYEVDLLRKVADGLPVPTPRSEDRRGPRRPERPRREEAAPGPRQRRGSVPPQGQARPVSPPRGPGARSAGPGPRSRRPVGPFTPQAGSNPPRRPMGPASRRPQGSPPRAEVPSRRIIGLEPERAGPAGPGGAGRPIPRRKGPGARPPRPRKPRPLPPRRRRPGDQPPGADEAKST